MKCEGKMNHNTTEERYQHAYLMLCHWLEALYLGHRVTEYFTDSGYGKIAIYGMGDLANRLLDDLHDSTIQVCYGIDRDVAGTVCKIENIFSIDDVLPTVDVVIVTPFYAFENIYEDLRKKIDCPIIRLKK